MPDPSGTPHVGLVLAGGGSRGAYEVGVVQYILEAVAKDVGRPLPIDILCGTSVGAINACALAASTGDLSRGIARLVDTWTNLRVADVVRPSGRELVATFRSLVGHPEQPEAGDVRRGGLLDPSGLEKIVTTTIPFERIDENLANGTLHGVTVSTTHVATGRTIVFVQVRGSGLPEWSKDVTVVPRAVRLRAPHALASAAIPLLFPAVKLDREFYCDGGLRQNVPLSPARRLGADGLLVVNPRHVAATPPSPIVEEAREVAFPGPFFLLGKALNALMLDRIDNDVDRLERINAILDAGQRRYGPAFLRELNAELGHAPGKGLRPLRTVLIRSSQDIGKLSAEFVRSPGFPRRVGGVLGKVMRRLAEGDARSEADLLSYCLFDGEFSRTLIELGRADARAQHDELCRFFLQVLRRETLRPAARPA